MDEQWKWSVTINEAPRKLRQQLDWELCQLNLPGAIAKLSKEAYENFLSLMRSLPLDEWWSWQSAAGVHCLHLGHSNYPEALKNWADAPAALWVVGASSLLCEPQIVVVGSREVSQSAIIWMNQNLPPFLRHNNTLLTSGGARGVDQRAHWLSLESLRPTIAVLPVGLQHRYPHSFTELEPEILRCGGAVVSPFCPNAALKKHYFERRNALMAALARMVLVVEARSKSGSLVTAQAAIDFGVDVGAVPWSALEFKSQGCLDLISSGAHMIRTYRDLQNIFRAGQSLKLGPPAAGTTR